MNFKEKIENEPILWAIRIAIGSVLTCASLIAIVLGIAPLKIVTETEYSRLKLANEKHIDESNIKIEITKLLDSSGHEINKNDASREVFVQGTAINAINHYAYLVVDDFNISKIQPGLGAKTTEKFSGVCVLGVINNQGHINKRYKVFAVVTRRKYSPGDPLDRETIIAQSGVIELFRTK